MASSEGISFRWEAFNRWCDEYADRHQGMKPKVEDVRRWHRENAEKVWPDSSERPSVFLAVSHNKGRRVRGHKTCEYYKRYRAGKAAEQQLAARLQPAALSGRRILAVTAAARKLNTDCSRSVSKRSCHDADADRDFDSLERAEKRRRMPQSQQQIAGSGADRGARVRRSSSEGDFSDDPSWASADVASDEEDDSGSGLAGHVGSQHGAPSRRLAAAAGALPRPPLHAGVHITVVRRDADGRTIQVQAQQASAQARQDLPMSQAGGDPATAALGLLQQQQQFGVCAGDPVGCPVGGTQPARRRGGAAGGPGRAQARGNRQPATGGFRGSVSCDDGSGPDGGAGDEQMGLSQHPGGAQGPDHLGQGWRRAGTQRRARDRSGGQGPAQAEDGEQAQEREADGLAEEDTGQWPRQRLGSRERPGEREVGRAPRHPGIAPPPCRGPRNNSASGLPGKQPQLTPRFSGYVETPVGSMPVYNVRSCSSVPKAARRACAPGTAKAASGGNRGSPANRSPVGGRPAGGLIPVASSKDPLDLLAQAACEALASPMPEDEEKAARGGKAQEELRVDGAVERPPRVVPGDVYGCQSIGVGDGHAHCGEGENSAPTRARAVSSLEDVEQQAALPEVQPGQEALANGLGGDGQVPCVVQSTMVSATAPLAPKVERQDREPQVLAAGPVGPKQSSSEGVSDRTRQLADGLVGNDVSTGCPAAAAAAVVKRQPVDQQHGLPQPQLQAVLQQPCEPRPVAKPLASLPVAPACVATALCSVSSARDPAAVQAGIGAALAVNAGAAVPPALASLYLPATVLPPATTTAASAAPALSGPSGTSCLDGVAVPFLSLTGQPTPPLAPAAAPAAAGPELPPGLGLTDGCTDLACLAAAQAAAGNLASAAALAAALRACQKPQQPDQQPHQLSPQLLPGLGLVEGCPAPTGMGQAGPLGRAGLDAAKPSLLAAAAGDPTQPTMQQQHQQQALLWEALAAGTVGSPALAMAPQLTAAAPALFSASSAPAPPPAPAAAPDAGYLSMMHRLLQLQMTIPRPDMAFTAGCATGAGSDAAATVAAAAALASHAACSALPSSLLDMTGLMGGPTPSPHTLVALTRSLQQSR